MGPATHETNPDPGGILFLMSDNGEGHGPWIEALRRWRDRLVRAAHADHFSRWIEVSGRADPEASAEAGLEVTIELVGTVLAYRAMDCGGEPRGVVEFLRNQVYDDRTTTARYEVYFNGGPFDDARLFVNSLDEIDIADLHSGFGFGMMGVVVRPALSEQELEAEVAAIEQAVREDLEFDFGEDEIEVEFESVGACVVVTIRDL